jgi:hypothetical protein
MVPKDNQSIQDKKLLARLLLQPMAQPSRMRKFQSFLALPIWDGVGAITGILSLIVTIILTFYIFHLSSQQPIAHMSYEQVPTLGLDSLPMLPVSPGLDPPVIPPALPDLWITVTNDGPAAGQEVRVVIENSDQIEVCEPRATSVTDLSLRPSRIEHIWHRCEIYYETFYSNKTSYIAIDFPGELDWDRIYPPLEVSVSGMNVVSP